MLARLTAGWDVVFCSVPLEYDKYCCVERV
jgi:hypothetical protein